MQSNLEPGIFLLEKLIKEKGWTVEIAAVELGDSPERLYEVLDGKEPLGRTATLATIALNHDLQPIELND